MEEQCELDIKASQASLTLTPNGWVINYGGRRAVIFDDIFSLEANEEIARQLGVDLKEAWALKDKLLEEWFPRSLDEYRLLFPTVKGEDNNIKALVLALFSHKLRNWRDRILAVIIQGMNSSGKSHLARTVLVDPFKNMNGDDGHEIVHEATDFTLSYFKRKFANMNFDRKILFLQQSESLGLELALMVSETGLVFGYSEFQDGRWVPVEAKIHGHPLLICTAVRFRGPLDWDHRFLTLYSDESAELTLAVMGLDAQRAEDIIFREGVERFQMGCWAIFWRIWKMIPEDLEVVVPYAGLLTQSIKFDLETPKPRRDFRKLLALIYACAIAHYPFRSKLRYKDRIILVATEEDLRELLPVLAQVLKQTVTGLNEKEEKIIQVLRERRERSETEAIDAWPDVKELAELTGINYNTLRSHYLPDLARKGFIYIDKDHRPAKVVLAKEPSFGIEDEIMAQCAERVRAFLSLWSDHLIKSDGGSIPAQIPLNPPENDFDHLIMGADHQISGQGEPHPFDQPVDQIDQSEKQASEGLESRNSTPITFDHLIRGMEAPAQVSPPSPQTIEPVCGECGSWQALKCLQHPDWIVVTPTAQYARGCPDFQPRAPMQGGG